MSHFSQRDKHWMGKKRYYLLLYKSPLMLRRIIHRSTATSSPLMINHQQQKYFPSFHSPPINKSPQLESARERAQLFPFLFTSGVLILVFTVGGTTVILNSAAVSAAVLQRPVLAGPVSGSLAAAPAAFLPRYFGGNPAR